MALKTPSKFSMEPSERSDGITTARALIRAGRERSEIIKYLRSVYSLPEPCAEECVSKAKQQEK